MKLPIKYVLMALKNKITFAINKKRRESIDISDANKTVEYIIANKCSVSRYGDGELNMVLRHLGEELEYKSGFQTYNADLGHRLYEILKEGGDEKSNFKVALPGCMFGIGTGYLRRDATVFWEGYSNRNLSPMLDIIDSRKKYLETNFSRFYLSHRDKSRCRHYIERVKDIWKGRDLLIVEGNRTCLGVGNDLFERAKSVGRILCPATNAWNRYDEILHSVQNTLPPHTHAHNALILCALGMTATVLAYDLAKAGYQAIDIGHIDIEYEWMCMGATSKVPVSGKFTNESKSGKEVGECADPTYQSQILQRI